MQKYFLIILLMMVGQKMMAQRGGESTYDFLNLTNSARVAALGGTNISIMDNDINMAYHNPALLQQEMNNAMVLNFVPYMTGVKYGYVGYAKHYENVGTFSFGIHNINYGDFQRTNDIGEEMGIATAAEYSFNLTYARQLSPTLSMGLTAKPIYSKLDAYTSFGLAADFGVHYRKPENNFSMAIVLKNVGSQITSYHETQETMPSDLQIGLSKKLAHAPFRFSITAQHLLNWDLTYTPTDTENENGSSLGTQTSDANFGDQLMRHMVFGVEFLPSKNFHVDFGYNHRRRKELGYEERMSTAGFSWGFGFRVYKFLFSYGSARYHLGGSSNHFSISTNLSNFK
ncbi:type IX secretion system protein PorQ [Labilibacter marinus]|uniref:type IX secretion system protein PorQ n=1 Tax=Labilibacter marinus TaxID=1477105 RepID=UPI000829D7FA|nr:type IX secretion system protein PorQ [Labilibacter marinus]